MKRLIFFLALQCLACAVALADPFKTYELIMWQKHTAIEVAGLKQLGFTALKMQATGGSVDPGELASKNDSGLPWYLENIATDFYSPYHRSVPDKKATWLFDDAKARRRADPSDESVFLRDPSLSDPIWLQRIQRRVEALAREQSRYHPLFYNLADEAGIGDLAAAWDADVSLASLTAMREWLREQYTTLPLLNAEWDTHFTQWSEVVPELTDAALRRVDYNFAAWSDFKAFMDVAFAHAVRAGADALHRAEPNALAGLEGGQVPGWGGYNYQELAPTLDVMEIYDFGDAVAIAKAVNPNLVVLRTSFRRGDASEAWRSLIEGGSGTIVWDEEDPVVNADGAPTPRGKELGALIAAIRKIAPKIIGSTPAYDPIAVLVSQASFRTQWLLDRQPAGGRWSDRDAAREYEDNTWRAARRETLERLRGLGLTPRLITSSMLEHDVLQGNRVLILPHAIALSDREVDAIRAFVASGGSVFADTEPGLFDGHGRLRNRPALEGAIQVPEALLRTGIPPTADTLEAEASLLAGVQIVARATFRTADGARVTGLQARWFHSGGATILALEAAPWSSSTEKIDVTLATPASVFDLREERFVAEGAKFTVVLPPTEPVFLSLQRQ